MAYYVVAAFDWTLNQEVIVSGPEVNDWNSFCAGLKDEVIEMSIRNSDGYNIDEFKMQDALIEVLKSYGYESVKFPAYIFSHNDELPIVIKIYNTKSSIENEKRWLERYNKDDESAIESTKERIEDLEKELVELGKQHEEIQ